MLKCEELDSIEIGSKENNNSYDGTLQTYINRVDIKISDEKHSWLSDQSNYKIKSNRLG